jgi:hypothetical protein
MKSIALSILLTSFTLPAIAGDGALTFLQEYGVIFGQPPMYLNADSIGNGPLAATNLADGPLAAGDVLTINSSLDAIWQLPAAGGIATSAGRGTNLTVVGLTNLLDYWQTNAATGAYGHFSTNAHWKWVDEWGSVYQTGTNGLFSITQSNGYGLTVSNGTMGLSGGLTPASANASPTNIQFGINAYAAATWSTNEYVNTPLGGMIYITNGCTSDQPYVFTNWFPTNAGFVQPPLVIVSALGSNTVTRTAEGMQWAPTVVTSNYFVMGCSSGNTTNIGYGMAWSIIAQTNVNLSKLQ